MNIQLKENKVVNCKNSNIALIGSILGDIAGSRFEWGYPEGFNYTTVELFSDDCYYTDDTVLSLATKYAVDNDLSFKNVYAEFCVAHPDPKLSYGGGFQQWAYSKDKAPYNSYGNGSAMRVGYIGERHGSLDEVRRKAIESACCTHNHPEGLKGAISTAECVWLAKNGYGKEYIRDYVVSEFGYSLNRMLAEVRPTSYYDASCQGTMPQALLCFLESDDYESCVRNVFSIACDVDTVACIAGGIAAAFYGETGFDDYALLKKYLSNYLFNLIYN